MGASPFLADLIRRAAEVRVGDAGASLQIVGSFDNLASAREGLTRLEIDVMILAENLAPRADEAWPWRTLVLSADLTLEGLIVQVIAISKSGGAPR